MTLLINTQAMAQQEKNWKLTRAYLTSHAGINGAGLGFTTHFNNGWTAFVNMSGIKSESENIPGNYHALYVARTYPGAISPMPVDEFKSYSIGIGRVISKPSHKAWLMATGGITVCQSITQVFTPDAYYFPNEDLSKSEKKIGFGATIGLHANLNLFRFMGVSAGATANMNTDRFLPGAYIGLYIGWMRPAKILL
jgi:hypothetical protein